MQSIEEMYEMYLNKVFLFLLSKTNNEHLAEELTQETFFQAVQCIDLFQHFPVFGLPIHIIFA
ncbi:MAG: sigma factor [Lachnospiraceae bacterium]|nr:sigma factor [Lachnospiraceae bacterium]